MTSEPPKLPPTRADIFVRAAIQALPKLAGSAQIIYEGFRERRQYRAEEFYGHVLSSVGNEEVIVEKLAESPDVDALFIRAIAASADTSLSAKRRALGLVVSKAIIDDSEVDNSVLIAGALSQMEAPHARCLEEFRRAEARLNMDGKIERRAPGAERRIYDEIVAVGRKYPAPVIALLTSLGLLDSANTWTGEPLVRGLTDFGKVVLSFLSSDPSS